MCLVDKPGPLGDCIFWDDAKGCTVYSARPTQCRTFPFWRENLTSPKTWDEAAQLSPGVNHGRLYGIAELDTLLQGDGETGEGSKDP